MKGAIRFNLACSLNASKRSDVQLLAPTALTLPAATSRSSRIRELADRDIGVVTVEEIEIDPFQPEVREALVELGSHDLGKAGPANALPWPRS